MSDEHHLRQWHSKVVVNRLQKEYPALIEYVIRELGNDNAVLPMSSTAILRFIVHKLISNTPDTYSVFEVMDVKPYNWLTLNKKTYEWVVAQKDINELMAFKLL